MRALAGVIAFILVAALAWFVVYPFVFNGVSGLFENNDVGIIVALAACAVVTAPLIWLAFGLVAIAVVLTGGVQEERRFKRERARRNKGFPR